VKQCSLFGSAALKRASVVASLLSLVAATTAVAQGTAADSVSGRAATLFGSFAGRWQCAGGTPSGKSLSAKLAFSELPDGHGLASTHVDDAPATYWHHTVWASDARTSRLLNIGVSGSTQSANTSPLVLIATHWSTDSVTFDSDSTKAPRSRFVYTAPSNTTIKMAWYLGRGDRWALGDSLICRRSGS
jgi:hypothetical protein